MHTLIFVLYLKITAANLFFSPPIASDETLSVMTIDKDASDEVFVAGENIIYKLSANLSQLMNVTVSNDSSVRVRGLSVSNGGEYIMACLTTGSCIGYDVINLNTVPLNEPGETILTGDDPVARGHQLPKKVYGFRNLWISSKDFTDFSYDFTSKRLTFTYSF